MKKAIYAFSGDPITNGHIDIIKRAASVFDELVVGIGINPDKKYLFNLKERESMAKRSLSSLKNVKVVSFKGLLVDYAYEHDIPLIVKGVRNSSDFNYENMLHQIGESQKLGIDTYLLLAKPELSHISSGNVKAIQKGQGLVHELVPLNVKQKLEEGMSQQYILGVTGEIGVGKSYICEKFKKYGAKNGIQVHNIDLDKIGHKIISSLKEPSYEKVRKEIVAVFGKKILSNGKIDRKKLGRIVFEDKKQLEKLNKIMHTPLLVRLRREMQNKRGLVLLNAALIPETGLNVLCNNNVLLVYADKNLQREALQKRGLDNKQIETRLKSQYSTQEKNNKLIKSMKQYNYGSLWLFENKKGNDKELKEQYETILTELNILLTTS